MYQRECPGAFRASLPLVLASGSPRREELLSSLGLTFEVRPSAGREPDPEAHEDPFSYALRLARAKAVAVAGRMGPAVVLGADTIVVLQAEIFGKPRDAKDAIRMLTALAGREHRVITACCIAMPGRSSMEEFAVVSRVFLAQEDPRTIAAYVATGEPLDKAGAYAVQGMGAFLVERIEGSYTNVKGLPLRELSEALRRLGVIRPR